MKGSKWMSREDWARSWKPWLRGTFIGFPIGALPAGGSEIPTFLSYLVEKKLSKHPEEFGQGAIEAVAGPEAANNASAAGVLAPLLSLGLPTSATAAIMLAAFQQYGLQPGPLLFDTNPELVWGMIASLYVGNVLLLVLNLPMAGVWVKLLQVPRPWLYAGILVFATMGAYTLNNNVVDLVVLWIIGIMGFGMRVLDVPVAPCVVGLILGPLAEQQFRRALEISQGDATVFFTHPISLALLMIAALLVIVPVIMKRRALSRGDARSERAGRGRKPRPRPRRSNDKQEEGEAMAKGSDLLVAALENEGVTQIFGVPGEENLDVVESLRNSKIELIVTRHEQTAAFLAATYGRLTGKPGVCISTLGPGALNLVTGAAYAHLGAMPMVMITGQKGIMSSRQARFQIVDMIATMRPLTKSTRQIVSTATIPTLVREAFRVAMEERPGPVHLELPEDIAGEEGPDVPLVPPHAIDLPVAHPAALDRAAAMILEAKRPLVMLGAGASRPRLAAGLNGFFRRLQLPFFTTQMGKGSVAGGSSLYMGTAALSERDYVHEAIDRADLILAIGHDTIEKPPFIMGPGGPKVIHVGYTPASVEQVYFPDAEVVGDVGPSLALLGRPPRGPAAAGVAAASAPAGDPRPHHRPQRRGALPADAAADRARRPQGDAGGRHRRPRQRHVQDLVRAELPHPRRQHAPARQRAGDDGRGPALGDDGVDALSVAAGCWRSAATAAS